jgi:hypothetical protein
MACRINAGDKFKSIDPDGYYRFFKYASSIPLRKATIFTRKGALDTNEKPSTLKKYADIVDKLTNNGYVGNNKNDFKILAVQDEYTIESIIYAAVSEATAKKIYGVYDAMIKKYGNERSIARVSLRLLEIAKIINDDKLFNEIINNPIANTIINKYPEISNTASNSCKLNPDLGEQKYLELADKLLAGLNNINPDWKSDADNLSAAKIDSSNTDLKELLKIKTLDNETNLNAMEIPDETFLFVALELNSGV